MYSIETRKLTKSYGAFTAVDSVDLTVNDGELFALLGINGAGKTTMIKMLTCLNLPTSGEGFIEGHSITTERTEVKRIVGVSPQETAVAPNLSVRENLEFVAGIYGIENPAAKAAEIIDSLHLRDKSEARASKLSGGQQRRLSIAMGLISNPRVLFLDEPTLGLDVIARRELWRLLESLKGKITIILTTHYLEEAEALSDRIGIIAHGKLLAVGTAEELTRQAGKDTFEDAFIEIATDSSESYY